MRNLKIFSELRAPVVEIARAAGEVLLKYYSQDDIAHDLKADNSPVTEADKKANFFIIRELRAIDSSIPCVSEEEEVPNFSIRSSWRRFWLVDPLDGTKEFIQKNGEFTVNIGLIEDGKPVLGAVYAPALSLLYYGDPENGSWKQLGSASPQRIYSRIWHSGEPVTVVESRSHPAPELESWMTSLNVKKRIKMGSSLKFCLVAEGQADVYARFGPTMEWDTAAGDAIYRYSGKNKPRESGISYNTTSLKHPRFIIGAPMPPPHSSI